MWYVKIKYIVDSSTGRFSLHHYAFSDTFTTYPRYEDYNYLYLSSLFKTCIFKFIFLDFITALIRCEKMIGGVCMPILVISLEYFFLSVFELTRTSRKNPFYAPTSAPPGCAVISSIPRSQNRIYSWQTMLKLRNMVWYQTYFLWLEDLDDNGRRGRRPDWSLEIKSAAHLVQTCGDAKYVFS